MNILMIGPQGVGKGTIGRLLSKKLRLPHLAMGDVMRDHITRGTSFGKMAKSRMDKGDFVPDEKVVKQFFLMTKRNKRYSKGMILDGFPRTIFQANLLKNKGFLLDKVIYLTSPDKLLIKRLSNRRVCPQCKRVYNLLTQPPKKKGVCDDDGTALVHRDDDKSEVVKHRLDVYALRTKELVNHLKKESCLLTINGVGTPQTVLGRVLTKLRK